MAKLIGKISGIILAGGEGKRLGGVDKGLFKYNNKPLVEYTIDTITPQVDEIIISANRNQQRYQQYTSKVVSDNSEQYLGPMAGITAALAHCSHDWVLIVACDTPFLPDNIIDKFLKNTSRQKLSSSKLSNNKPAHNNLYIAQADNKLQLLILLHKSLHHSIKQAVDVGQLRLMHWVKSQAAEIVVFKDKTAFKNFNNNNDFGS